MLVVSMLALLQVPVDSKPDEKAIKEAFSTCASKSELSEDFMKELGEAIAKAAQDKGT